MSFCTDCAEELEEEYGNVHFYYAHRYGKDEEKIEAAEDAYVTLGPDESIVMVYDATLFGAGDEGVALTTKGVYYQNDSAEDWKFVPYDEISEMEIGGESIWITKPDGKRTYIASGYLEDVLDELCDAIHDMRKMVMARQKSEAANAAEALATKSAQPAASEGSAFWKNLQTLASHVTTSVDQFAKAQAEYQADKRAQRTETQAAGNPHRTEAPTEPNGAETCTSCGAKLVPHARFCSMCGAPVKERPAQCPVCGAQLEAGARFCSTCGYPVAQGQ